MGEGPVRIGMLVFDDVEELDFVGPLEVFGIAARLVGGVEGCTVTKDGRSIRGRYGLRVTPDYGFAACPPLDLLVVPGGPGAREGARRDPETLAFVGAHARRAATAGVCTGALVLAAAGVLDGRRATTHTNALGLLREHAAVAVVDDLRVVWDGDVVTSAGVSAGIDLALDVVAERFGEDAARETARVMEYPYAPARGGRPR